MNITSIAPRLWGRRPGKTLAFLAIALFLGLAWSTTSHASTAAYTTIRNEVTVQYADAGGNPQADLSADVEFSVALVASTPILNAPGDQAIDSASTATYDYTLTATANGLDTYDLSAGLPTLSAGITGATVVINGGSPTMDLGATTAAAVVTINNGSNTTIEVPSDMDGSDSTVNGIAVDDIVVIDGNEFTVVGITDNGGVGTSEIIVASNGTTPSLAIGEIIGERGFFTVTVTPGTITDATSDQTITLTLTAQDAGGDDAAANDVTVTTVTGLALTVTKYVRNTTNANAGSGEFDLYGDNSVLYYTGGVEGAPGDVMEYLVQISNTAGSSTATDLIIIDLIPQFTTYVSPSIAIAVDPSGPGDFVTLIDSINGDAGEYDSTAPATVRIYAGSGGLDSGTGGTLAGGSTAYGRFRVSIDN